VLYWGVSEWTAAQIDEAVGLCDDHGWHRPASNQPVYNMIERHWEAECFPMCARHGLGIVCFSPLAQGLLTGKYDHGVPPDTRGGSAATAKFIEAKLTEANLARVRKLGEVAAGLDVPLSNLALAWCLRRPELTSCIVGASRASQLDENVEAVQLELDEDVMERVAAILG